MIGIVITGHGKWASGMLNAITLLAGKPEHVIAIDFLQEDSSDDLSDKLKQALKDLEDCESIAIFTDVLDATPYREALEVRQDYIGEREIEVITGTNLGMVMQGNISRSYIHDVQAFCDLCMEEGKRHISCSKEDEEENECR